MSEEADPSSPSISQEELECGRNALTEFNKKNYNECMKYLSKYENTVRSLNWKIIHNKSVIEFYKNDMKNYEQFEKVLQQVTEGKTLTESYQIKDSEKCSAFFNLAVIMFHLRQPFAAIKILTEILKHLKLLEESFVQKVGLLTINLLLDTNRPKQALHVMETIQNRLGISKDTWIMVEFDEMEEDPNDKGRAEINQDEFLKMFRFCFIRTTLLNGKIIIIPTDETANYAVLKAHQYYMRNDYQMAAKELSKKTINEPYDVIQYGENQNTVLANNMGLIHFCVRHYAMAVRFFQHALTFDQATAENVDKNSILHTIGASRRPEILYNLGVAMLHLQRPKEAFECLLIPLNHHHNNPKLWLRLAEACIMVHKQGLKLKENKNILSSVAGVGIHRKYIIQPSAHKYISDEDQSFAIPSPNLEFASLCLRNALTLIEHLGNQYNKANQEPLEIREKWRNISEGYPCNPSKGLTHAAFAKLKCAILAAYSYVSISLGEYTLALKHAKELLMLKNMPDTYKMLGHLYCAESLIMMDRVVEAVGFLEPKFIADLNGDDFEKSSSPDWNINSCEAAQSIMKYNLAVTFLYEGEIDLAKSVLIACKHPIVLTNAKMLRMYMDLLVGNVESCKLMVRRDTPQYS